MISERVQASSKKFTILLEPIMERAREEKKRSIQTKRREKKSQQPTTEIRVRTRQMCKNKKKPSNQRLRWSASQSWNVQCCRVGGWKRVPVILLQLLVLLLLLLFLCIFMNEDEKNRMIRKFRIVPKHMLHETNGRTMIGFFALFLDYFVFFVFWSFAVYFKRLLIFYQFSANCMTFGVWFYFSFWFSLVFVASWLCWASLKSVRKRMVVLQQHKPWPRR